MLHSEIETCLKRFSILTGYDFKVSYAISRARPFLLSRLKELFQRREQVFSEPAERYRELLNKLSRKHAKKDSDGKAMTLPNGEYDILDVDAFVEERQLLEKEQRDDYLVFKADNQAFADFLNSPVEIDRWKLPLSLVQKKIIVIPSKVEGVPDERVPIDPPTDDICLLSEVIDFDHEA